jgi:DNA-binding MarR family transcriptional regulator
MEDRYEAVRLKNQLCFPIYLCAKEITRRYGTLLEKLGLTYTQYVVMMFFWEKKQSNVKELGKTLMLDPSTLTPILRKLEEKGFLTRTRSHDDERSLTVALTEEGAALADAALPIREEMQRCMGLSGEESEALYRLIAKVLSNVENQ